MNSINSATKHTSVFTASKGLTAQGVVEISRRKNEPEWMQEKRIAAFELFGKMTLPSWGADLSDIDFENITYYIQPQDRPKQRWEDVPEGIKQTFDALGIPEAEKRYLGGVGSQFESEVVYHSLQETLREKGVAFESMDEGLKKYPELVQKYFGSVVPPSDNKFAALNTAAWSGGSFIYVPKGVDVELPLQAYFRINTERMGQFERTLIIADEGSRVHYVEGCSAPTYSADSLHAAVVEIIVHPSARVQYTTIQNWSTNVYNLVTKRAIAYRDAEMIWLDCNIGSKVTMKYPSIFLRGEGARGEIQSFALATGGQHQDAGGKVFHMAPKTTSRIVSKSLSADGGRTSYRGLAFVAPGATGCKTHVSCDALLIDDRSRSDTYPSMKIHESDTVVAHEASVARISEEQLFFLRSRGLPESEATSLLVNGFAKPIVKQLPMEYAVELNRLINLEMKGAIG